MHSVYPKVSNQSLIFPPIGKQFRNKAESKMNPVVYSSEGLDLSS